MMISRSKRIANKKSRDTEIFCDYLTGLTYGELATQYKLSKNTIFFTIRTCRAILGLLHKKQLYLVANKKSHAEWVKKIKAEYLK